METEFFVVKPIIGRGSSSKYKVAKTIFGFQLKVRWVKHNGPIITSKRTRGFMDWFFA